MGGLFFTHKALPGCTKQKRRRGYRATAAFLSQLRSGAAYNLSTLNTKGRSQTKPRLRSHQHEAAPPTPTHFLLAILQRRGAVYRPPLLASTRSYD